MNEDFECITCPEYVNSINEISCNCQSLNISYNFILEYNICDSCPNGSSYNSS